MCNIEHFGHLLAIAFSVSAIFYYVDMRKTVERSLKDALTVHDTALRKTDSDWRAGFLNEIFATAYEKDVNGELRRVPGGPLSFRRPSNEAKKREAQWHYYLTSAVAYNSYVKFSRAVLARSLLVTNVLVVISTASSMSALIVSGYYPELKIGCGWATVILVLSYVSITWNILFFLFLIPKLVKRIERRVRPDPQAPALDAGKGIDAGSTSDQSMRQERARQHAP
jgi:hypothetical protein